MDQGELKEIERRQLKHWSLDGLPELMVGLGWLVWGVLNLIGATLFIGMCVLGCGSGHLVSLGILRAVGD